MLRLIDAIRSAIGSDAQASSPTAEEASTQRDDPTGEEASTAKEEPTEGRPSPSRIPANPSDAYDELGVPAKDVLVSLVRREGGWTWQGDLVAATDWHKSSVSRLLADLEDDERIRRETVGRRNVVGLPEALAAELAALGERTPRGNGQPR